MKSAQVYSPQSDRVIQATSPHLKVATLNIAHGRGRAVHQGLLSRKKITANLDAIVSLLSRGDYDIIALQEVDEPSLWSSSLNQAEYLTHELKQYTGVHGIHVHRFRLRYGTALLSRFPVLSTSVHTYASSPPLPPKGYTAAVVSLPHSHDNVLVISLHLDPIRPAIRLKQAEEVVTFCSKHTGPLLVLGDFNDSWNTPQSVVVQMTHDLSLQTFEPKRNDIHTFRFIAKRIDWILCSQHFSFQSHDIDAAIVSDHFLVHAELAMQQDQS